jgi:hypothetical protein
MRGGAFTKSTTAEGTARMKGANIRHGLRTQAVQQVILSG